MNPTDTPRTNATPRTPADWYASREMPSDPMTSESAKFADCIVLSKEVKRLEAEVERLRELLEKALFEIEKVPFQNPKLTAFTAHRLADRYRKQLDQLTK